MPAFVFSNKSHLYHTEICVLWADGVISSSASSLFVRYQLGCLHAKHFFNLCLYVLECFVCTNVCDPVLVMRNHLVRVSHTRMLQVNTADTTAALVPKHKNQRPVNTENTHVPTTSVPERFACETRRAAL